MGTLHRVTISGYRGFQSEQTLQLATRRQAAPALTILVGPNGGGKTTVLEALEMICRAESVTLPDAQRNKDVDYYTRLSGVWDDNHSVNLASTDNNPAQLQGGPSQGGKRTVRSVSLRRGLPNELDPQRSDWITHAAQQAPIRSRSYNDAALRNRIVAWNPETSRVRQWLKEKFDITLRPLISGNVLRVKVDGAEHSPDGLGEGVVYLLHLLDALSDPPDNALVLIDEPETALHPAFVRELFDLMLDASLRVQIVYATHSPYMLDFPALLAGAVLARVVREEDGCKIYQLPSDTLKPFTGDFENLSNPHVLGTDAREAFFLRDRVILVEGQDDVVYYRRMAEQVGARLKGRFFGWGAGGAGSMKYIAQLLKDLGFKKVIGILDNGKTVELGELKEAFREYHFRDIPANDVRDKTDCAGNIISKGLCERNGKIHDEHLETVKELMNWISKKLE